MIYNHGTQNPLSLVQRETESNRSSQKTDNEMNKFQNLTDTLYNVKYSKYNISTKTFEDVDIEPKSKIKFKYVESISATIVSIDKIKPNPWNEIFYPKKQEERNIEALAYGEDGTGTEVTCMVYRLKKNRTPNHEAIKVCPITGIIWSGHNRYYAAILAGAKEVLVTYAVEIYSEDIPPTRMLEILHQYNNGKRSEFTLVRQVEKVMATLDVVKKQFNVIYEKNMKKETKDIFDKFFKPLLLSFNEKNMKYIKNLILIGQQKDHIKNKIFKDISEGRLALTQALKDLRVAKKNPYNYNPDRFKFLIHYDNNIAAMKRKALNYLTQARNCYFSNMTIKTEDGKSFNLIIDKTNGNESPKRTSVLSDVIMSIFSKIYNELDIKAITAGNATNSADIQFPELTAKAKSINITYPGEEIEVKTAVIKKGNAIFFGGPDMKRHIKDYIIAVFNEDHSKVFLFMTTINGPEDVKSGSKDKTTMDLKTILKNHKNDVRPILGSIDNDNIVFKNLTP